MMAQYRRIKGELPKDALLLFRLGDFYEMFFEDAVDGAHLLNVALTKRGVVPMCGIPHHAFNSYVARLLRAGRKVAVCDQMEEAKPGQLVKREVTQILSPGTHFDERLLAAERNNFLAAVYPAGKTCGIAVVDLTTGDFRTTETESDAELLTELERLRPAETIYPGEAASLRTMLAGTPGILIGHDDWVFAPETAVFTVREHFKVASLDGYGLQGRIAATGAAGAVLHYLIQHLRRDVRHLTRITFYQCRDFLVLDSTTLRNLEILEPLHRDAPRNTSLYGALNRTVTPMGARLLRHWLTQPLSAVAPIRRRQDAVQSWHDAGSALEALRVKLAEVRDLERTLARLSTGTGNGRDLHALRLALEQVPALREILSTVVGTRCRASAASPNLLRETEAEDAQQHVPNLLFDLTAQLTELPALVELVGRAIVDEPPLAVKEGGLIRDGFDANLDELRAASRGGKDWIAQLKQKEVERTGIASLKVGFNSVFGYYIEITKANLDKVPADYIRKQTIANGERFITPELKAMEGKILGAEERAMKLEYELFLRVREEVIGNLAAIQQTAAALAQLDVLAAFAETARLFNYTRPEVSDAGQLLLKDARHPVLDQALTEERFVPNDTELASSTNAAPATPSPQIALITGPNMAGKSTYIRQVALLALLAHTGSFLPAAAARVDLVDRIFTRIGASDDLARGQSTFMVEMSETANILNNATPRSLVILDEIGRGTSTFDGLSLAWSILEHLHNQVGAKTLFATHYHELTELAARLPRLRNFNVAVREWHDQIIFLRKIVEGGTDKSYGIQVARLAGVPREVLERAKVILRNLEDSELTPEGTVRQGNRRNQDRERLKQVEANPQMDFFG
ncbi:MAG: DNA mismatch repair protein MutS [Verrucomicrobia bacterium]|nr:DNA mismatch repair protein MutS [Verrucomicrobiota bacterium]